MQLLATLLQRSAILFASAVFLVAVPPAPSHAVEPDEILKDAQMEKRARAISQNLRCLVCQNQSIDDSNAPLARDLRLLVRERLKAGDSDAEVLDFAVQRYGEFVLLRPPFALHTLLLWLAPLVALGGAIYMARKTLLVPAGTDVDATNAQPLSETEQQRLDQILGHDETSTGKAEKPNPTGAP